MNIKTLLTTMCPIFMGAFGTVAYCIDLPNLGPTAGTAATVNGKEGNTVVIYKTQKICEDLKPGQACSWLDPKLSMVEVGSRLTVTKHATHDDPAWFLTQVKILSGRHAGQTWWIHTRSLKVQKVQGRRAQIHRNK